MRLSEFTIKHLSKMIAGDTPGWPSRSGWRLAEFFNHFGFHDEYHNGFPTRYIYAEEKLKALNGTDVLRKVFRHLLAPPELDESRRP